MKYRDPLKEILSRTRPHWDREETRPSARRAFCKVMQCRTLALGAEVYASENEERRVDHTCKSPACSSCGNKTTIDWRREGSASGASLPRRGGPVLIGPLHQLAQSACVQTRFALTVTTTISFPKSTKTLCEGVIEESYGECGGLARR